MLGNAQVHTWMLWSGAKRPAKIPCFPDGIGGSLAAFLILSPGHTPPMQDPSFRRAQQYYARLRQSAYALVQADALASGMVRVPLRLADCTAYTLSVWQQAWAGSHPSGWGGWDWGPLIRRAWRRPASFHLAIWSKDTLCGLAVGRVPDRNPDGSRSVVFIDYLESAHDPGHPLRGSIAILATSAAHAYGRLLQAGAVRLKDPLPGVIALYAGLGFGPVYEGERVLYCERRIEP